MRVLVVEDEPGLATVLRRGLAEQGFAVDVAGTGEVALWFADETDYHAMLLDLGLPDRDGLSVLTALRRAGNWVPVLVLTARDGLPDRVAGLDSGADDYLVKPFEFPELLARVRALVRRGARPRPTVLTVGDLVLDPAERAVSRGGIAVHLAAKEFALLECFMRQPGQVLTRPRLIADVWDFAFDPGSNVVDVYVGYLRAKIDRPFGRRSLQTVRGAGYRLVDERAVR